MALLGLISEVEKRRALEENLNLLSERVRFRAPHSCDFILQKISSRQKCNLSKIQTSLDLPLQEKVEILLKNHLQSLESKGITNGAAVTTDNATGEILSWVGSKDFFDDLHDGQVNGVLSLRQPGSTLKPFTYALALEKGMTTASLLEDRPTQFKTSQGNFMPENFDRRYHGTIRMRSALACSYNIPAVSVLQMLGPDLLYQRLKALEFDSLQKSADFYGMGLTLGNGEVSLLELVRAYATLARGGIFFKEKFILQMIDNHNRLKISETTGL